VNLNSTAKREVKEDFEKLKQQGVKASLKIFQANVRQREAALLRSTFTWLTRGALIVDDSARTYGCFLLHHKMVSQTPKTLMEVFVF